MNELHGSAFTTARAKELRRAMTDAERALWERLRARRLGVQFRRQYATQRFILDFYAPKHRLVIEVDGPIHESQRDQDAARNSWLAAGDIRTLRFTNDEVLNRLDDVVTAIRAALSS